MLLIIFFLLFSLVLCQNNNDMKKYDVILKKIIFSILFIYIGLIFWKTQNRATLYFYLIIFFSYIGYTIYSFKKVNLIRIFLIFLIPIILFNLEIKLKIFLIKISTEKTLERNLFEIKKLNSEQYEAKKDKIAEYHKKYEEEQKYIIINNNNRWKLPQETSGRMQIWKQSIPFIKKILFFGQGPQSDRNLLNKNASNIFIYILLCSGIFGIIFLFIYLFSLLIQYLRFIIKFKIKNFDKDYLLIFSNLCVFFFYLEAW